MSLPLSGWLSSVCSVTLSLLILACDSECSQQHSVNMNGVDKMGTGENPVTGEETDRSSCLMRMKTFIPTVYRNELVELFNLGGPVIISQAMIFMIGFVSTVFCGHLGKTELASVALAIAVVNVTGISIGTGLSLTCDTLISQTYGSGNLKRVGVILQRGVLILLLACFPCWAVLLNTEVLLLLVRQTPDVASYAQLYVNVFMPALPAAFMYQLESRYLQNQEIIWPQVITGAIGNILNAVINYVFLWPLDMGVAGSAAANAISQYTLAISLFIYINVRGLHRATWSGWTQECLQEWGSFVQLAIPSMLMMCLEWWIFEIGGFLAGIISEGELGSHSVLYELVVVAYMIPLGLAAAASVRVGNALGAGNVEQAKFSAKVPMVCGFLLACAVAAIMVGLKDYIAYIFTTEPEIIQRVSEVMIVFGFTHLGDAVAGVAGGVVRGAGKQKFGAVCNLVGFYVIGTPIGVSLMFAAKMGIVGLWTGLCVCTGMQSIFLIIFLCKLNWKQAAKEAQIRAGVQIKDEVEMKNAGSNKVEAAAAETPNDQQVQDQFTSSSMDHKLSRTQLVLRRGVALLIMLIILCAGIVCNVFLIGLLK